jgi:uncharacterized protein involved in exopolysaccharide biosynthesis
VSSESAINDYLNIIWRRRWLVLLPTALGVAASMTAYKLTPPVYQARATLVDEHEAQGWEGNRKTVWDNPRTALERLQRDDFVIPVARQVAGIEPGGPVGDGLPGRVRKALNVEMVGNLVYFKARAQDPEFASKVANSYAQVFVDSTQSRRENRSGQTATFYDQQLEAKKTALDDVEKRLARFAASHRGSLPDDVAIHMQAVQQLQAQLSQAESDLQARRDERETFVSTLAQMPPPTGATGDGAAVPLEDPPTRLRRLQGELADLRTHLTEKHPDVQQKLRDIRALEAEIAAAPPDLSRPAASGGPLDPSRIGIASYQRVLGMDREITRIEGRITNLTGQIARHNGAISAAGQNAIDWSSLSRERANLQNDYNNLLTTSQKADLNTDMVKNTTLQNDYRILELSNVPQEPIGPLLVLFLSIGLGAGVAVGAGTAVVAEMMDQTYQSPDDLVKDLNVPVIATIVRIDEALNAGPSGGYRRKAV